MGGVTIRYVKQIKLQSPAHLMKQTSAPCHAIRAHLKYDYPGKPPQRGPSRGTHVRTSPRKSLRTSVRTSVRTSLRKSVRTSVRSFLRLELSMPPRDLSRRADSFAPNVSSVAQTRAELWPEASVRIFTQTKTVYLITTCAAGMRHPCHETLHIAGTVKGNTV